MKTQYRDLIEQTFDWPQEEFNSTKGGTLTFHGIDLMELAQQYGTPLKFTYLPKIGENIGRAISWFNSAFEKHNYDGQYHYCYVTKSSHFSFVIEEALKNGAHLETSSPFDLDIVKSLYKKGAISTDKRIICNGFKKSEYVERIKDLVDEGFTNIMPILDNDNEVKLFGEHIKTPLDVGIRIASEEEPKFEFYTSRLGIGYRRILPFFKEMKEENPNLQLKMLHFFVNTGIRDTAYYWNELLKTMKVYCDLKRVCPTLDSLNIGGGFPIKNSLGFDYDYAYIVDAIVQQIQRICEEERVPAPHIYTEFGSFTVGESGGALYKVIHQKAQNDREKWNMIDSSFMTTLPDSWAINRKFIMLPLNHWDKEYERVFLGGLTCDSDDYYNSEQHMNAIYLPTFMRGKSLYIGFFNTGAYQESIGGYGGVHHCLIPGPKHILIDKDEEGNISTSVFSEEQTSSDMLNLLGYE
ncbi:MAG: arginine decarboxylase [Flavobacteriales bacterium]|nr:arginine decarboxylase [Flavobacteriales bacterium]MDG1780720.1 arginine decarboxylase [Flavobacteriales bacterium]MDG2247288.1 arginine decarboxylase [Flavobacteriales bacterium]